MSDLVFVGCAGWSIPQPHAAAFPPEGSHLERYARRFNAVEINSSFYRPHRRATYERWAATVPPGFRFSVKVPKAITHERRLADADDALDAFLDQATGLGEKLGPLLLQLPPSLVFDPQRVHVFFTALRTRFAGSVVCEPRHSSWGSAHALEMLHAFRVARVEADPPVIQAEMMATGELFYLRLHGSPRIYYSEYRPEQIAHAAEKVDRAHDAGREAWCIFDNTAAGAATGNALALQRLLQRR